MVSNCCKDFDSGGYDILEFLGDFFLIFYNFKVRGVKIVVCIIDSCEGILFVLDRLGLMGMIDKVVCGDDKNIKLKFYLEIVFGICEVFSVCLS